MKRVLATSLVAFAALAALAVSSSAQTPAPPVFPSAKTDVFVSAQTFATTGEASNYFTRGASVVFRAYAADVKTKKVVTDKTAQYFYVTIPGQPNVKLAYGKVGSRLLWTGTWTIPATYSVGLVEFKVLVKTKTKRYGSFVQAAVPLAMLTVTG